MQVCKCINSLLYLYFWFKGPSDYTSKFQTISFTSGQGVGSQVSISIPIVDDNIAEGVESFLGSLPLLPTTLSVSASPDEAEIFIQDDDSKIFCAYFHFLSMHHSRTHQHYGHNDIHMPAAEKHIHPSQRHTLYVIY